MGIRQTLDNLEPHFHKGGKYEKFYPLYEAVDTIFYSPPSVAKTTAHVRDGVDLKRIMITKVSLLSKWTKFKKHS